MLESHNKVILFKFLYLENYGSNPFYYILHTFIVNLSLMCLIVGYWLLMIIVKEK
jgi:hypothetical protein